MKSRKAEDIKGLLLYSVLHHVVCEAGCHSGHYMANELGDGKKYEYAVWDDQIM